MEYRQAQECLIELSYLLEAKKRNGALTIEEIKIRDYLVKELSWYYAKYFDFSMEKFFKITRDLF